MNIKNNKTILITIGLTLTVIATWLITGGDYYTKYEIVKEVVKELDQSDPLVAAGFYDNNTTTTETVTINEFRLGLLPTPSGPFDKHMIAVVTLLSPIWFITFILLLMQYRKTLFSKKAELSVS